MSTQQKQWGAIIVMIALFAMIAFVTNLCTPMATIIKNQGEISNVLAQIGNYGNFVAYLVMGIPAGMLISKYGYKKTALIGLVIGLALAALGSASNVMAVEGLDIRDQGMALAVVQVFIDLSYIVGPVAYGYAVTSVGYSGSYTAMAVMGLAALCIYLLTCSPLVRGRMTGRS